MRSPVRGHNPPAEKKNSFYVEEKLLFFLSQKNWTKFATAECCTTVLARDLFATLLSPALICPCESRGSKICIRFFNPLPPPDYKLSLLPPPPPSHPVQARALKKFFEARFLLLLLLPLLLPEINDGLIIGGSVSSFSPYLSLPRERRNLRRFFLLLLLLFPLGEKGQKSESV